MSYGEGAAAQAAATARAIKASGAIVRVGPEDFVSLVSKATSPLVVMAQGGWRTKNYQYLTSYKGLIFFTKSETLLHLPGGAEIIAANKIWIPS